MAPKKKQIRNAFFFFMAEFDKDYRKGGKCFPGGLKAISEKVSPMWQSMSAEQRRPYEELANSDKGNKKYTTHGQTYEEVDEERRALEDKRNKMFNTMRQTVAELDRNRDLSTKSFFLIHMNYLCKTGDGTYYPAEIALSSFSIQGGAATPYHTLVNPGPLPSGYAYKAMQHAADTHHIDASSGVGERDVVAIVTAMEEYVEEWQSSAGEPGELPPFYTLEKFVPSIEEMLGRWAKINDKPPDYFRVYLLEELFFELKCASLKPINERELIDGKVDEGFVYSSVAAKKLGDDPYSYKPRIGCDMHEELDVAQHCSRSYVVRWGWLMCDHLCPDMGVVRQPGKHCPYDTKVMSKPVTFEEIPKTSYNRGAWHPHGERGSRSLGSESLFKTPASLGPPVGRGVRTRHAPPPQAPLVGGEPWSAHVGSAGRGAVPRTGNHSHVPESSLFQKPEPGTAVDRSQPGGSAWGAVSNPAQNGADPPRNPDDFEEADFFPALSARRNRQKNRGARQAGSAPVNGASRQPYLDEAAGPGSNF